MWKREVGWFVLASLVVVGVLLVGNTHWIRYNEPELSTLQSEGPDYSKVPASWVGRSACFECHADVDTTWVGSDHDLAMQLPGPDTITANFNNSTFTHYGITTTFYRADEKYMVRTDGPDGTMTDFEIAYIFGYYPIEQYLIRFPDGRLQALNVCWDTHTEEEGGQRWFHLYPDDETPADDLFHWTGMLQNWNFMCAECHSTNLKRNYDETSNTYTTVWSELDVSCEACHGPGSRHITWERAYAQGLRPRNEDGMRGMVVNLESSDQGMWLFEPDKTTAVRSKPLASRIEVESCARCHARRAPLTATYAYGRPFLDDFRLTLLNEGLYHADGQNMDEVYVYGSFLQSKMYASDVTCSDCHDPHSTRPLGDGNQVCAKCHKAEIFDTPDHHFHQMGKGGDSCLDCHMQSRKVMVVDGRRDHSFRIPRPDLSLELGTPNACSDCHQDQTVQWSQDAIIQWYGAERLQGPHYAVALHAGRVGSPLALDRLRFLVRSPDQPDIAKATALSLMPRYAAASDIPEVVQALGHTNALVRAAAVRSLASSPPERQLDLALPLVQDPVLNVRIAAAGIISQYPRTETPAVSLAHDIWRQSLTVNLERPESLLEMAELNIALGHISQAEKNFQTALAIAPLFSPTYVNYADFLRRQQRQLEAMEILNRGIATATNPGDIHHALGLLLITEGNLPDALTQLEAAASLQHESARYSYVLAVALHDSGQIEKSLSVLEESLVHNPWDWDSLLALTLYSLEVGQPNRAVDPIRRMVDIFPDNTGAQELFARVRAEMENE